MGRRAGWHSSMFPIQTNEQSQVIYTKMYTRVAQVTTTITFSLAFHFCLEEKGSMGCVWPSPITFALAGKALAYWAKLTVSAQHWTVLPPHAPSQTGHLPFAPALPRPKLRSLPSPQCKFYPRQDPEWQQPPVAVPDFPLRGGCNLPPAQHATRSCPVVISSSCEVSSSHVCLRPHTLNF